MAFDSSFDLLIVCYVEYLYDYGKNRRITQLNVHVNHCLCERCESEMWQNIKIERSIRKLSSLHTHI